MKIIVLESQLRSDVVYHGTNNKFGSFDDSRPIFFTDNIEVAKTYGDRIVKAKLDIQNPIELDFEGNSTYYFWDKWYVPSDLANTIKSISEDLKNHYALSDEMQAYLESLGFSDNYGDLDGIVMRDIDDAHGGVFSNQKPATHYVVFNKNQIRTV